MVSLVASDAGDGNEHDFVVWQQPRLVAPGRPDLLLRDVREVTRDLAARRKRVFAVAARYLDAAAEAAAAHGTADVDATGSETRRRTRRALGVARLSRHRLRRQSVAIDGHFTNKLSKCCPATTSSRAGAVTKRRCCWPTRPTSTSAFPAT